MPILPESFLCRKVCPFVYHNETASLLFREQTTLLFHLPKKLPASMVSYIPFLLPGNPDIKPVFLFPRTTGLQSCNPRNSSRRKQWQNQDRIRCPGFPSLLLHKKPEVLYISVKAGAASPSVSVHTVGEDAATKQGLFLF